MCGWCFGFSGIIQRAAKEFSNDFEFDIISGGMVVGAREGKVGEFADYIISAYPRVEEYTGVKFGELYLTRLKSRELYTSSVKPAIAIEAFKVYNRKDAIAFASAIQYAYFVEGKDLESDEVYLDLIKPFDIIDNLFHQKLKDESMKEQTFLGFKGAADMGIKGYPALLAVKDNRYYPLTHGFVEYETIKQLFEKLKAL